MIIKFSDVIKITLAPFLIYITNEFLYRIWTRVYIMQSLDTYAHLLGGMAIAEASIVVLQIAERADWIQIKCAVVAFFVVVAFVMAVAVLWEFYEFAHDYLYGTHFQPSNADTMKDLFMGTIGAIVWYLFHFIWKRRPL